MKSSTKDIKMIQVIKISKMFKVISKLFIFTLFFIFTLSTSHAQMVTAGLDDPPAVSQEFVPLVDSLTRNQCQGLFANNFDPSDNLMSSIMSFCLSGVLVNLHRLEQQECEKILCEYRAAQQGISPIGCAKQNAFNTCMITGQGFDVVEGLLIGSLRNQIRQILENPLGFGIEQLRKVLEKQVATCNAGCSTPAEKAAAIGLAVLEIPGAIQTIQDLMNQLSSVTDQQDTACQRLEDVRVELEDILNQYYSSRG